MTTLYNLADNYRNILALLGDATIPDYEIEQALSEIGGEIADKCSNGIGLLQQIKSYEADIDNEIKRLQAMKKHFSSRRAAIENVYINGLTAIGADKNGVMTSRGVMKVKANPPKLVIDDEYVIPRRFVRTTIVEEVDKAAVKSAIKCGEQVDGAHLEQGKRLSY